MRIVVLRHEQRGSLSDFDSPLTDQGVANSDTLPNTFKEKTITIDEVYSSPYIRCIQTILPLCTLYDKKIKVENALCEFHIFQEDIELSSVIIRHHTDTEKDLFNIDENYDSVLSHQEYQQKYKNGLRESIKDVLQRIWKFTGQLLLNASQDKTVLLATHMSIVNAVRYVLKFRQNNPSLDFDNFWTQFREKNLEDHFPMGHFVEFLFET
jgi:broad specificity phosphatase PhoE